MQVRAFLEDLVQDLVSGDQQLQVQAAVQARCLLEQSSRRYYRYSPDSILPTYENLLPEPLLDVALLDEDIDSITDILRHLLAGPPRMAAAAAFALEYSVRPRAIPELARMLRHYAGTDGHAALQAVCTLDKLGRVLAAKRVDQGLTDDEQGWLAEVVGALRFAARVASDDNGARSSARSTAKGLTRLVRRCRPASN